MNIELINTGSELMLGRVLNRHQQWLCRQLADHGYVVGRQTAVSDAAGDIRQVVGEALSRAQLVITTGGLGPTSDDLTREAVADLFGVPLVEDTYTVARLEAWFAARNRTMPERVRIQAMVPKGAEVWANEHGTAPGLAIPAPSAGVGPSTPPWLVMLPGPTRELHPMVREQLLPWLRHRFPSVAPYVSVTLRSIAVPESAMQERIEPALGPWIARGLEVGYCAHPGEVDVRLAARGHEARAIVRAGEEVVRERVGTHIYGTEDETLEQAVVGLLAHQGRTVAVAESCTGGRLASRITDVPGASAVFVGGVVSYSNALKEGLLGVSPVTLATHGAVSEAVAREMAAGARSRLDADFALAITGIAGPAGGTADKPVGTVFIALAEAGGVAVVRHLNRFEREVFKHMTSQQALEMLRQRLLPGSPTP